MSVEESNERYVGETRPRGTAILHHVNLKTTRKEAMVEWYVKVLNMRVNVDVGLAAFLSNDRANHRLALTTIPGITFNENKRFHDGVHHTAYEYATFDELNELYLRLRDEGILPKVCIDHRTSWSYYYEDPDGNMLEMQVDDLGDWDLSTQIMRETTSIENAPAHFFGISVDPEQIAAARAAGASFEEIKERTAAFEFSTGEAKDYNTPEILPDFAVKW
ncbi:VOC family protein [Williamsia soli]|uniref:VOC family protein n=1 Tax=Williamsia soli TaxID=364929 RepID=UPI001A9FFC8E|nr:VOC family protein [Williamsia soli]